MIDFGEVKLLKVAAVTSIGAFVDGGREKDILLPFIPTRADGLH